MMKKPMPMKATKADKPSKSDKKEASPMTSQKSKVDSDEEKWRVESAMSTLERAEEHKADPDLMRKVHERAQERAHTLNKMMGAVKVEKAPKTMKGGK